MDHHLHSFQMFLPLHHDYLLETVHYLQLQESVLMELQYTHLARIGLVITVITDTKCYSK